MAGAAALLLGACGGGEGGGTGPAPPGGNPPVGPPVNPVDNAAVTAGASSNDFTPATVDVKAGGTVTWSFGARAHEVIFQAMEGTPSDIPATTDAQVVRTFGRAGTFPYSCSLHQGMTGTVRVH